MGQKFWSKQKFWFGVYFLNSGSGTNAADMTTCFANCENDFTVQTHASTKEFQCGCNAAENGLECKWNQNPRAANMHPGLLTNNTDLTTFASAVVWPACQPIHHYETGKIYFYFYAKNYIQKQYTISVKRIKSDNFCMNFSFRNNFLSA